MLRHIASIIAVGVVINVAGLHADIRQRTDNLGRTIYEVGISSISAQQAAERQSMNQWCWAACISTLFNYYGHPVSQARIVRQAYGGIVNMPASPNLIFRALNRRWVDDNGVPFTVVADVYTVNNVTAANDLQANHPLIIGTMGHAVLLTALTYYPTTNGPYIIGGIVRDPWPTRASRRPITPTEWANISFAARVRVE